MRSRVELSKVLADTLDMTMFDYKAGVFRGVGQPKPLRARKTVIIKKKSSQYLLEIIPFLSLH